MLRSLSERLASRLLRALPERAPVRGERRVPGLRADVLIRYTDGDLPHLSAASAEDLFFAQGWLCASERLFQMELARRTARGELAEIFGRSAPELPELGEHSLVDVDLFLRRLSLAEAGRQSLDSLGPLNRLLVDAYAAGVSAWIAEGSSPLEHQLLGLKPRLWTAADSAAVWKLAAFQQSRAWRAGLVAEALRARFLEDPRKVRALLPDQRSRTDTLLPPWPEASKLFAAGEALFGLGTPGIGGSNAWAFAGPDGRPILSGDLHLPPSAPSPLWLVHLKGGGFDVAGASVPGVPGVVVGHNESLAWSFTSGATMDAQWALERLGRDLKSVKTAAGFEPLETSEISIRVRGESQPVIAERRHSPNGPILEGPLVGRVPEGHLLALRWTGHLPTPDLDALLDLDRAHNPATMNEALSRLGTPALNIVWADTQGRCGWRFAGLLPRYRERPALGAVSGWGHSEEWDGIDAADVLPPLLKSPVVSANQKLTQEDAPLRLGDLFSPPWRAQRIAERLEEVKTLEASMRLLSDTRSGFAEALRERFLFDFARRSPPSPLLDRALSGGDREAWALAVSLARTILKPLLGEALFHAWTSLGELSYLPFLQLLSDRGAPFLTPVEFDERARKAVESAEEHEPQNSARFRHPLDARPLIGPLFAVNVSGEGDGSSIARRERGLDGSERLLSAAVFRHSVEVGRWDEYRVVLATGQGGDPLNGRYRNHVSRWQSGQSFVMPFGEEAVETRTQERVRLRAR